jgi:hypothetical protein
VAYLFFAYLMVLFSVWCCFRSSQTSSAIGIPARPAKACWIVLLIVLPSLTVIVYVIMHSSAMAERSAERTREVRAQQESYIKDVAGK